MANPPDGSTPWPGAKGWARTAVKPSARSTIITPVCKTTVYGSRPGTDETSVSKSDASQADRTLAMISFLNERLLMQSLPLYGQINVQLHTQQEKQLNRGVLQMCFGSLPPIWHAQNGEKASGSHVEI